MTDSNGNIPRPSSLPRLQQQQQQQQQQQPQQLQQGNFHSKLTDTKSLMKSNFLNGHEPFKAHNFKVSVLKGFLLIIRFYIPKSPA